MGIITSELAEDKNILPGWGIINGVMTFIRGIRDNGDDWVSPLDDARIFGSLMDESTIKRCTMRPSGRITITINK